MSKKIIYDYNSKNGKERELAVYTYNYSRDEIIRYYYHKDFKNGLVHKTVYCCRFSREVEGTGV